MSNSEQVSRTKFEAERLQRQLESLDAELHNLLTDKDAEETLRSKYRMEREMKERDEIQIETELEALKRKRKGDEAGKLLSTHSFI